MKRNEIISIVGNEYLTSNIENDEYSYRKAFKQKRKDFDSIKVETFEKLDIRFTDEKLSLLIETKPKYKLSDIAQLQAYVDYEKALTGNRIIAILASTETDDFLYWEDTEQPLTAETAVKDERSIKTFSEYYDKFYGTKNDKISVVRNTYALNELLHGYGIGEKIRSQFVGTCLLALKNNLQYSKLTNYQIRSGIEGVLTGLLDNITKAQKIAILKGKVIDSQEVRNLTGEQFEIILDDIKNNILPYINDKTSQGQDLLNLFFTTFNKYVGKADKNQAFTPDHIVHFMCKVVGINRNSVVLDPCCGSGAFLVRALTEAMNDCDTEEEKDRVKREQIYGIEYDETAFGLSTTNMLIHGDGNSNIIMGNCFDDNIYSDFSKKATINTVLMNPPYNATKNQGEKEYSKTWKKEDPSKGFHFVYEVAKRIKTGKLAVLLPMQCAIGSSSDIQRFKKKMLEDHTLDAVFSLPSDMFHPGASASACCMVFNLGTRHINAPIKETFFGYYKNDGFAKRKNLGRVEKTPGSWAEIEKEWLQLYFTRSTKKGISVTHQVTADDEWLAEAYMETDYTNLSEQDFEETIREYYAFIIKSEMEDSINRIYNSYSTIKLKQQNSWKKFRLEKLFSRIYKAKAYIKADLLLTKEKKYRIPLITRTEIDNGCDIFAFNDGFEYIESANAITIGDTTATCFYQNTPFITGDHMIICRASWLNKYTGLFMISILKQEKYKYNYGRAYKMSLVKSSEILLPATASGEPDWQYMEDYIKSLPYGDRI